MIEWLKHLPEGLLIVLIVGTVLAAMMGAMLLPRKLLFGSEEHGSEGFDSLLGISAAIATLLIFSLTDIDGDYRGTEQNVSLEAEAIHEMNRDIAFWDKGDAAKGAFVALKNYAQAIPADEWPRLANGQRSARVDGLFDALIERIDLLDPATPRQETLYSELVTLTHDIEQLRERRIAAAQDTLPVYFWYLQALLSLLVVVVTLYLHASKERILLVGAISAVLSLLIATILIIDGPFIGGHAISPAPFERVVALMDLEPEPGDRK